MKDLILKEHKHYIDKIVSSYIDAEVEIVENVVKYYKERCGEQNTVHVLEKLGMALWNSPIEPNRILLQNNISTAEINDHLLALTVRNFSETYNIIQSSRDFMIHLVLHEVAHIKHNWAQSNEIKCDEWAFEELKHFKT